MHTHRDTRVCVHPYTQTENFKALIHILLLQDIILLRLEKSFCVLLPLTGEDFFGRSLLFFYGILGWNEIRMSSIFESVISGI